MSTGLCPHCLVGMYPAEGPDGHTWYCGDCGYETPRRAVARERRTDEAVMEIGGERMNGAGASTATAAPVPGPTWDRLARARLDVLIAAIGEVDALKREAAVIHRGLRMEGRLTPFPYDEDDDCRGGGCGQGNTGRD